MMASTGMLTQLLKMCNQQRQNKTIVIVLMRVMIQCTQDGDITTMKNCFYTPGTIAMVQRMVKDTTLGYIPYKHYLQLYATYFEFMQYFFQHEPRCRVWGERDPGLHHDDTSHRKRMFGMGWRGSVVSNNVNVHKKRYSTSLILPRLDWSTVKIYVPDR